MVGKKVTDHGLLTSMRMMVLLEARGLQEKVMTVSTILLSSWT